MHLLKIWKKNGNVIHYIHEISQLNTSAEPSADVGRPSDQTNTLNLWKMKTLDQFVILWTVKLNQPNPNIYIQIRCGWKCCGGFTENSIWIRLHLNVKLNIVITQPNRNYLHLQTSMLENILAQIHICCVLDEKIESGPLSKRRLPLCLFKIDWRLKC